MGTRVTARTVRLQHDQVYIPILYFIYIPFLTPKKTFGNENQSHKPTEDPSGPTATASTDI